MDLADAACPWRNVDAGEALLRGRASVPRRPLPPAQRCVGAVWLGGIAALPASPQRGEGDRRAVQGDVGEGRHPATQLMSLPAGPVRNFATAGAAGWTWAPGWLPSRA